MGSSIPHDGEVLSQGPQFTDHKDDVDVEATATTSLRVLLLV